MSETSQGIRLEFFGLAPNALATDLDGYPDRAPDSFCDRVPQAPEIDHNACSAARGHESGVDAAAKLAVSIGEAGDVSGTVETRANALRSEMGDLNARVGAFTGRARAG